MKITGNTKMIVMERMTVLLITLSHAPSLSYDKVMNKACGLCSLDV